MSLFPFTPEGVQSKLNALYALSNELLFIEASSIELGFANWMKANFIFTSPQEDFLDGINEDALNYYGSQCALCFRHRLDIRLIYPTPPTAPGYAKWPEVSNTIIVSADNTGQMNVTGSLTFTMTYRI